MQPDLFPPNPNDDARDDLEDLISSQDNPNLLEISTEWYGSHKYSKTGTIGKGAFATVYKVTSRFDGTPFAAKELDKRRFMKNGQLDQKVENEMRIMQRVSHVRPSLSILCQVIGRFPTLLTASLETYRQVPRPL